MRYFVLQISQTTRLRLICRCDCKAMSMRRSSNTADSSLDAWKMVINVEPRKHTQIYQFINSLVLLTFTHGRKFCLRSLTMCMCRFWCIRARYKFVEQPGNAVAFASGGGTFDNSKLKVFKIKKNLRRFLSSIKIKE
jgi:hypothetical protein